MATLIELCGDAFYFNVFSGGYGGGQSGEGGGEQWGCSERWCCRGAGRRARLQAKFR